MRSLLFLLIIFQGESNAVWYFDARSQSPALAAMSFQYFPKSNFSYLAELMQSDDTHFERKTKLKIATQNDLRRNDTTRSFCIGFYRRHSIANIICNEW